MHVRIALANRLTSEAIRRASFAPLPVPLFPSASNLVSSINAPAMSNEAAFSGPSEA